MVPVCVWVGGVVVVGTRSQRDHRGRNAAPLTGTVRATRLDGVRIELTYDGAGNRLRRIGDFQISYDKLGSRPRTLGSLSLDYDMAGNRLHSVGADVIEYDKLGSRPTRFGSLELAYDRLGTGSSASGPWASNTTGPATGCDESADSPSTTTSWVHVPDTYGLTESNSSTSRCA